MEATEKLSKAEYQYLRTIEKSEELILALETQLQKKESANEQLIKETETLKSSNENFVKELNTLITDKEETTKAFQIQIEKLNSDLEETTKECQAHITDIEAQNDVLEKNLEELKIQILPEDEMRFYHCCKADIILAELYRQKRTFTLEELKEKNFPVGLLEVKETEPSGIETANFKLIKSTGENVYKLLKK